MRPMRSWPKRAWVGMPNTVDITHAPLSTSRGEGRVRGPLPRSPATPDPHPTLSLPMGGRGDAAVMLLLHQWALALVERPECLVGGNGRADLVVVPRRFRFRGLLHLHEVGGMDLAPVHANHALAEERIVGGHLLHLGDDLGAVVALERLHRLEIVGHCGVDARVDHSGMDALVALREALAEGARLVIEVPVERLREDEALGGGQA